MGHQVPTHTAKAQLSMKLFLAEWCLLFLWNGESRQEAQLLEHWASFISRFPLTFILRVY